MLHANNSSHHVEKNAVLLGNIIVLLVGNLKRHPALFRRQCNRSMHHHYEYWWHYLTEVPVGDTSVFGRESGTKTVQVD